MQAILTDPEERITRLPLLAGEERQRVLIDWNDTRTRRCHHGTFFERFADQVNRMPNATAVSAGQGRISYGELARRSSAIADRLTAEGLGREVVVILLAERSIDYLAAMIAVQGACGAFLPLDPALSARRLAQIAQHSRALLVLTTQELTSMIAGALSDLPDDVRPRILDIEELSRATHCSAARPLRPSPSSLAYVIYTSGSTGFPKGAMVEQRGMLNHLYSQISDLDLSASDIVAQTAPQSFVISVWQFLSPLMIGARVHICSDATVRDPVLLMREIEREGVTVLQIVPSLLRAILERTRDNPVFHALGQLRLLMCCGEALAPDLLNEWFRHFPNVPMINAYGSTECSDDVTSHRITMAPGSIATVPIGRPIRNTRLYVLDAHMVPVPIGVPGELFIGGIGVGRGYLNDPEQTRQRFLHDPFSSNRKARLYRTGDLGRWRADGTLEFLGRVDHQVKIRGCRIEPGEIEHLLLEHADVQAATVMARGDQEGETWLIAHVVCASRQPNVKELREFLKAKLPDYMLPAGFVFLEQLPLTPHGKINRRALLETEGAFRTGGNAFMAPRHATEQVLATIWADLLKLEQVGILDNFFDLGGHSLLAGRVLARIATTFGISLSIRELFEAPTIESLALRIEAARKTPASGPVLTIDRVEKEGPQPVSTMQEHVLSIERELPELPQFNLRLTRRLQGPLNVHVLEDSVAEVVRRHESLRTNFVWVNEHPVALAATAVQIHLPLTIEDLSAWAPVGDNIAEGLLLKKVELEAEQDALELFDLARGPLFRARLFRLAADDHVLHLTFHHIIVDGWSIGVFMEEVSAFYSASVTGGQLPLLDPELQFSDFARWQRRWAATSLADRQFDYWKTHLAGASPVFPTVDDLGSALLRSPIGHEPIHLSHDLIARLRPLSHSQGGTLFMALLTGFKALLLAKCRHGDICVATAMANRAQERTERIVGPLENTAIIRSKIDSAISFREALARVRGSVLDGYARQDLPFDILTTRLAAEDGLDLNSLMQVFFVLQNPFRQSLTLPGVVVGSFGNQYRDGQLVLPLDRSWLTLMISETPSGVIGSCTYKTHLFDTDNLRGWLAEYRAILFNAVENPDTPIGRLTDG